MGAFEDVTLRTDQAREALLATREMAKDQIYKWAEVAARTVGKRITVHFDQDLLVVTIEYDSELDKRDFSGGGS